ncbi:MAG: hypothetical protein ACE5F9_14090 [Phycisphaerae bacterium]
MDRYAQPAIVQRKRTLLSTLAWGLSATVITLVVCGSGIVLYGMNIADRKSGNLIELVDQAVQNLPEIRESLPPVLADALNDSRRPDYADKLDVEVRLSATPGHHDRRRAIVEVHNGGDEVVSLMSMRIVVLDKNGDPLAEANEWVATPFAADRDWRGPLMPDSTRQFPVSNRLARDGPQQPVGDVNLTYEITEIRTWNRTPANGRSEPTDM